MNEVATTLFMSAPLLGVDKELKNNVPPPRATSGMPFFQMGLQLKGGVNIELINNWTGVPFFLKCRSCPLHTVQKSPVVLISLSTWSMEISEAL